MPKPLAVNPGDTIVYVPEQALGENIHHSAVVKSKTKTGRLRLVLDTGERVTCSLKRCLVGQLDAFETKSLG